MNKSYCCEAANIKNRYVMGQALIRVSHKNKGSISPDDPVPFLKP